MADDAGARDVDRDERHSQEPEAGVAYRLAYRHAAPRRDDADGDIVRNPRSRFARASDQEQRQRQPDEQRDGDHRIEPGAPTMDDDRGAKQRRNDDRRCRRSGCRDAQRQTALTLERRDHRAR